MDGEAGRYEGEYERGRCLKTRGEFLIPICSGTCLLSIICQLVILPVVRHIFTVNSFYTCLWTFLRVDSLGLFLTISSSVHPRMINLLWYPLRCI